MVNCYSSKLRSFLSLCIKIKYRDLKYNEEIFKLLDINILNYSLTFNSFAKKVFKKILVLKLTIEKLYIHYYCQLSMKQSLNAIFLFSLITRLSRLYIIFIHFYWESRTLVQLEKKFLTYVSFYYFYFALSFIILRSFIYFFSLYLKGSKQRNRQSVLYKFFKKDLVV